MCSIAGMVGIEYNEQIIETMLRTMMRRGPDSHGVFVKQDCCLLHSRLAVIDREHGQQPMTLVWDSDTYTLVYNGELYNIDEIRRELQQLGHSFTGHSDTEVILHAYVQWKDAAINKLNGIFAFAVWEENQERLFIARDRMGVKPLFYQITGNGILFASELKTLLAHPQVRAEVDAEGVAEILLLGPGRTPGSGVFRGIQELEPGWCGYYAAKKWHKRQYWKLTDREHNDTFEQTVEKIRYLVTDSIRRQLVSDVPVGAFLSGGLDSSLISAVSSDYMRQKGEILRTFSVDYANNDKYFIPGKFQPESDNAYILTMQEYLGSDHSWTVLTPEDLLNDLENATIARDLPGMADVDFSMLALCRRIKQSVTVALSGECADEIFGGYPWYRDPAIRMAEGFPWAQNTKYRSEFLSDAVKSTLDPDEFVKSRYWQTIRESDILPGTSIQERRMKEMVNLNHRWFMQTLLDRKDRMSMYHGLEVRVPFCDYRIAEYMYSVPWEYKDYQGMEKGLLRLAMKDSLPDQVLYRKKSPYPKTYDPKYLSLVSQRLRDLLEQQDAPIHQIVNKEALRSLLNAEFAWPWYGQLMRVPQTIAYMLQINFWMEHYNVQIV